MNQHLSFLISQSAHIQAEVYRKQYPDIQYPKIVPVDTSAPEWVRTITHYSMDRVGKSKRITPNSTDIPMAEVSHAKHDVGVEMEGIGYGYNEEELAHAQYVRMNIQADKADAARRAAEEALDNYVINGDAASGWDSFIKSSAVTAVDSPADGAGNSTYWKNKSALQIIRDVNDLLLGVYTKSKTVEMADTICVPPHVWSDLVSVVIPNTAMTVLEFIEQKNVYTRRTRMPLGIIELRGLESAAAGNKGRLIAYRRDMSVLRLHLPKPFRFEPAMKVGPWSYYVPGSFRTGGLEVRRPSTFRYLDAITEPIAV